MKALILVCGLTSLASSLSGQDLEIRLGGAGMQRGVHISETRDGGLVAVGVAADAEGHGGEDVLLVKVARDGSTEWQSRLGGPGSDNGWAVVETADGYVIAGFTDSRGAGDFDCYLLGVNASGEETWSKTFGGAKSDRCWSIEQSADGGFALAGETESSGAGEEDCWLVRVDAEGSELWNASFGGTSGDRCFSLAEVDGGGFIVAGQTYSNSAGERDAYIIRTDEGGNELWTKTYGGPARDVAHSVSRLADGDFLVTGYTFEGPVRESPQITRLTAEGDERWRRTLRVDRATRTLTGEGLPDGRLVLGGFAFDAESGRQAAVLLETDAAGEHLSTREFFPTTNGVSFGYTARATSASGALLTGHTSVDSAGDWDLFVVRVQPF